MIQVVITKNQSISNIKISGHALYQDYGKDIVCAAVSSILITSINAMGRVDEGSIAYDDKNGVEVVVKKHSEVIDILLDNLLDLLTDLQKQYPKNIKITIKNKGGVDCV